MESSNQFSIPKLTQQSMRGNFFPKKITLSLFNLKIQKKIFFFNLINFSLFNHSHSIIKISTKNIDPFEDIFNLIDHSDDDAEILWFDNTHRNNTYAFVRVEQKSLNRIKRDLRFLREEPTFITDNLQSWLDAEHSQSPYRNQPDQRGSFNYFPNDNLVSPPSRLVDSQPHDISLDDNEDEPLYNADLSSIDSISQQTNYPFHYSQIVPMFVLNRYYPIAQINRFLHDVAAKHPSVTVFVIGYTHENRPIKAIEILNNPNDPHFMWIDGCTHAREWITVTTALYIIEQAIVTKIPVNFIIVPVLNVDGYVFTWTRDRMWRKNRRPYVASRFNRHSMPDRCTGVDLNRNYDINFGGVGSSKNPCSFLYQGPHPFSEPEVRAASDLLANNRNRIKMTLSLHSFNQLWSCPNAYSNERTRDHNHHMNVLKEIQKAVLSTNNVLYDIGPLGSSLYLGSGFMMDWIYHKLGIRDAYLVELRDRGFYGFILPADQIWPTATETWQGVQAAIKYVFA